MYFFESAREATPSSSHHVPSSITSAAAWGCLVWYIAVWVVSSLGYIQLRRHYKRCPEQAELSCHPEVTIIRPIKGIEPCLWSCLASTYRQIYPASSVHIRFCIPSRSDPSHPILEQLLRDFPDHDAQILIEGEDELLVNGTLKLGPNPKIRNMSRAYREAQGDVVWIVDCNVWVDPYACGRMIKELQNNKFVHLLPLVVDVSDTASHRSSVQDFTRYGGARLEEMFLSTSHAKFYTAINTVSIAPCIVGKSTMFRISHLNSLTYNQGIDYFSYNICEDHLIGDLLWKRKVPSETESDGSRLGKHALCWGDLAIQPMNNLTIRDYWNRRVRWLRVRKFTVTLATFVEPGTESLLCSLYGAFALTTLPFFKTYLNIPQTWSAFAWVWLLSVSTWCAVDRTLYKFLHSRRSTRWGDDLHASSRWTDTSGLGQSLWHWSIVWMGREALAFPIWFWAFWGGTTVEWRGKRFWVGTNMKVHEIEDRRAAKTKIANGHTASWVRNGLGSAKGEVVVE